MKCIITLDVYDEHVDEDHPMGVTNDAFERLLDRLSWLGDDIDIRPDPEALD